MFMLEQIKLKVKQIPFSHFFECFYEIMLWIVLWRWKSVGRILDKQKIMRSRCKNSYQSESVTLPVWGRFAMERKGDVQLFMKGLSIDYWMGKNRQEWHRFFQVQRIQGNRIFQNTKILSMMLLKHCFKKHSMAGWRDVKWGEKRTIMSGCRKMDEVMSDQCIGWLVKEGGDQIIVLEFSSAGSVGW